MPLKRNRLANEKSPYLLQHAHNPVNWFPWGDEAFEKAAREDKPIFLSIGYSTCHWCHVMEKESFNDEEVARLMNETFVSIKVDREERPDIDNVYMSVAQVLSGAGGWPLNIVMTPEKKPFFAGTYFPKSERFGQVGMLQLIPMLRGMWNEQREEVESSADRLVSTLTSPRDSTGPELGESVLRAGYRQLADNFDERFGGFGRAPKFPTPHNLLFLLRYWKRTGEAQALRMVEKTLRRMRRGGIYDQIGFGFHRYSTDRIWLLPHFEKMLYDQALISMAYLEAYQATKNKAYADTAREIFAYVIRDMRDPDGGFYSAEDADTEGEEGKFYLWPKDELANILSVEEAYLAFRVFGIQDEGNFLDPTTGQPTGLNILYLRKSMREEASELGFSEVELAERLEAIRGKLFAYRERRVRPHRDDKILADWNGLMIAALALGARVLGEPKYEQAAEKAALFIRNDMLRPGGSLSHRYREGQALTSAFLDDYAFLVWGLIELYESVFNTEYLKLALDLNDVMLRRFSDETGGGFFLAPSENGELFMRPEDIHDGALPSGNGVAAFNLLRLARLTGRADLDERAAALGRRFSAAVSRVPAVHTQLLMAVDLAVGPSYEVVVSGRRKAYGTQALIRALRGEFLPSQVTLLRDPTDPDIASVAPFTEGQEPLNGEATAYVCANYACLAPTTDPAEMLRLLETGSGPPKPTPTRE